MGRFRALGFGLLASTALATPALAQNSQPQTTGQSPAPGTNATDVTAPPPPVQQRQDGLVPDLMSALYREKNCVEQDFRHIKSEIELRPLWHHTDAKVRAHVTLCMLALLVDRILERTMREAGRAMTATHRLATST